MLSFVLECVLLTTLSPNLSSCSSQYVFCLLAVAVFFGTVHDPAVHLNLLDCVGSVPECVHGCIVVFVCVCVRSNLVELCASSSSSSSSSSLSLSLHRLFARCMLHSPQSNVFTVDR